LLIGSQYFDDEWRFFGGTLLNIGLLIGAIGFLTWWSTHNVVWRYTWGRLL